MSPRKDILRQLARTDGTDGEARFAKPSEIPGFEREAEKYQKAVNELLRDRLIEGRTGGDGRMIIAINPHKLPQIRRELRAPWANPLVWAALTVVAALALFLLAGGASA